MAKYPNVTAGQTEACINRFGGWDNFLRFIGGEGKIVFDPILNSVGIVALDVTTDGFVAREKFVINTSMTALVKIGFIGNNFTNWFLSGRGTREVPKGFTTLKYSILTKDSVFDPILAELGENAETTLTEVIQLMELQGHGNNGVLLIDGFANIFYVRDQEGALRSVVVIWNDVSWRVSAFETTNPREWHADNQVF